MTDINIIELFELSFRKAITVSFAPPPKKKEFNIDRKTAVSSFFQPS